jgi:hypothetical protein
VVWLVFLPSCQDVALTALAGGLAAHFGLALLFGGEVVFAILLRLTENGYN